jgi:hypothetical protein
MIIRRLVTLLSIFAGGLSNCDRKSNIRKIMVSLLLVAVLGVSGAIRPSSPAGNKAASRRPLRRLWYRRFEEGSEDVRRMSAFDLLRDGDNSRNKNALSEEAPLVDEEMSLGAVAVELSTLLAGIENLAEELETHYPSIPPPGIIDIVTTPPASGTKTSKSREKQKIKTVHELRHAVLDEGKELRDLQLDPEAQLFVNATTNELLNHDVIQLMVQRFKSGSTPGNRAPEDTARLALSIEGGGMYGAVILVLQNRCFECLISLFFLFVRHERRRVGGYGLCHCLPWSLRYV